MSRWLRAAVVATVAMVAGCGGEDDGDALTVHGERVSRARLTAAVEGLCDAREQAAAGDLTEARSSFYDRSHEMLHTVASGLEPVDRGQAARLLEAKQAVEADLTPGPSGPSEPASQPSASPPRDLVPDLSRLIDVTRAGLDRLQVEVAACPE